MHTHTCVHAHSHTAQAKMYTSVRQASTTLSHRPLLNLCAGVIVRIKRGYTQFRRFSINVNLFLPFLSFLRDWLMIGSALRPYSVRNKARRQLQVAVMLATKRKHRLALRTTTNSTPHTHHIPHSWSLMQQNNLNNLTSTSLKYPYTWFLFHFKSMPSMWSWLRLETII